MKKICLFVFVWLVGVGWVLILPAPANAQQSKWFKHKTSNGCAIFSLNKINDMRNVKWTGACVDGLAQGEGVLSMQENIESKGWYENRYAAGTMQAGYQHARWFEVSKTNGVVSFLRFSSGDYQGGKWFYGPKDTAKSHPADMQPATFENVNAWLAPGANNPELNYVTAAAKTYFTNPSDFYAGNFKADSASNSATTTSQMSSSASSQDDPKVFGRSARGG